MCFRRWRGDAPTDDEGRLRLDDWEPRDDVQIPCKTLWPTVTTESLKQITDYAGYKHEFLQLFGFLISVEVQLPPHRSP